MKTLSHMAKKELKARKERSKPGSNQLSATLHARNLGHQLPLARASREAIMPHGAIEIFDDGIQRTPPTSLDQAPHMLNVAVPKGPDTRPRTTAPRNGRVFENVGIDSLPVLDIAIVGY